MLSYNQQMYILFTRSDKKINSYFAPIPIFPPGEDKPRKRWYSTKIQLLGGLLCQWKCALPLTLYLPLFQFQYLCIHFLWGPVTGLVRGWSVCPWFVNLELFRNTNMSHLLLNIGICKSYVFLWINPIPFKNKKS